MQERARVIARPDDVVRLELEHVGPVAVEADLMTPLVERAAALHHRVVPVRRLVMEDASLGREPGAVHSENERPMPVSE